MSLSKFECLPDVVLDQIAVALGTPPDFLGPPTNVLPMLVLSKKVYAETSWSFVFSEIFRHRFDASAPVRRLCDKPDFNLTDALAKELVKRFESLRRFKYEYVKNEHVNIDTKGAETLRTDLWRAYLMFLENDGKNAAQLVQYAAVDVFAASYISTLGPLWESHWKKCRGNVNDEVNSLAMELFWYTEKGRFPCKTPSSQNTQVSNVLVQTFAFPSEYPSTLGPVTIATAPPITTSSDSTDLELPSLEGWPVSRPCKIPSYFGQELTLVHPPIAQAALRSISLRYTTDYERFTPDVVLRFQGQGLKVSEMQEYHAQPHRPAALVALHEDPSAPGPKGSRHFDQDWLRLFKFCNPRSEVVMRDSVFTPGTLQGKWIGDFFDVDLHPSVGEDGQFFLGHFIHPNIMEFELREFHQHNEDNIFPFNDVNHGPNGVEGVLNAWFPLGTNLTQFSDKLEVSEGPEGISSLYQAYIPTAAPPHNDLSQDVDAPYDNGVWDIILLGRATGSPEGSHQYYGRVRSWDGLAVIFHEDAIVDIGTKRIFYGYLRENKKIVGRWRDVIDERWSGAWTMTKCS